MNFPDKKYQIIYADPPWEYDDKALSGNRGAGCKYDLMNESQLQSLPVGNIADENCLLFMWSTFPKLQDGLTLMESWGFTYKTVAFTWLKTNQNGSDFMGMGRWTRANQEIVLFGTKGKPKRINAGISQVVKSVIKSHSQKPNTVRDKIIELVGDLPRIELFARTKVHGWDVWGNDEKLESVPLESWF